MANWRWKCAGPSALRLLLSACLAGLSFDRPLLAAEFKTGSLSFSDELGGFRLLSARGSGSADDPYRVVEEIFEVEPVTLVIRRLGPPGQDGAGGYSTINLVKVVANRSNRVWAAFEIELQEVLRKPSTYADGLSFNQIGAAAADIASDTFAANRRQYEPDDRIRFENGHVDPDGTATFRLTITDPTPTPVFYLVQDPQLLSAALPGPRYAAAAVVQAAGSSTRLTPLSDAMWSESVGR